MNHRLGIGQCGWVSVNFGGEKPSESLETVEKGNSVIFLDFHGKTNSRLLTV